MRKIKSFIAAAALLAAIGPFAAANGLNLNGLGARAVAMGGAFVGLADDFSALFWNPAGLTNIKTATFGAFGTDIIPSGTYKLTIPPPYGTGVMIDAQTETKHYLGGMAAYIHPISENVVAAIGVYTPSGLGAAWDGTQFAAISGGRRDIEWKSKVGLLTIAPSLAFKVNDMLSFGASLNINYGMFDTSMYAGQTAVTIPTPPYSVTIDLGQYEESETGWGLGATLGVQFKPSKMFSLGAVLRTASTVKFSGTANISSLSALGFKGQSDMERSVTWPMWIAGGVALFPAESLIVTADIQWTQWSKIQTIATEYKDASWALLMQAAGKNEMALHWNDAVQIRFGAEVRLSSGWSVRAGYYFDPSPTPDRTMNVLLPSYDFNGLTFGVGYSLGSLNFNFGFEYLMGKERTVDWVKVGTDPAWSEAVPGVYGMKILVPCLSLTYKFN